MILGTCTAFGEPNAFEEFIFAESAATGILRMLIGLESVIDGLVEITVTKNALSEFEVERLDEATPVIDALDFSPAMGEGVDHVGCLHGGVWTE